MPCGTKSGVGVAEIGLSIGVHVGEWAQPSLVLTRQGDFFERV